MSSTFMIGADFVAEQNKKNAAWLGEDLDHLSRVLQRRNIDAEKLIERAQSFEVALPSWGVGTGGTRFARFPGPGEPRNVYAKLDDCATVNALVRSTPAVSLHIPWDKPEDAGQLKNYASER